MTIYGTFSQRVPKWDSRFSADCPSTAQLPASPPVTEYLTVSRSRSGSSLPNYKALIKSGNNATTNFVASEQTYKSSPMIAWSEYRTLKNGGCEYHRKRKAWWSGPLGASTAVPSVAMTNVADNRARTAFYKQYENALTSFSGGVALGELKETLHMIRNPAKALREAVGSYISVLEKGRKGKSQRSKADYLGKAWLEYSFGIMPLINDVDDAMSYFQKRRDQLSVDFIHISGHGEAKEVTCSVAESPAKASSFYFKYERRDATEISVNYKGAIRSDVTGTSTVCASALGLAPRSFVPTLWEVLPWSFAIDYFTNVGDVITAYSNGTAKLAWGCKTSRTFAEHKCFAHGMRWSSAEAQVIEHGFVPGFTRSTYKTVNRSKVSYVPLPDLQFEVPGLGSKWINLAALVASRKRMSPY